jgi:hypothetical protein
MTKSPQKSKNKTNHEFQKRRETSWWQKRRKTMSLVGTRKKRMPFLTPKSCNGDKVRSIFKLSKPTTRQPQKKQSSFHSEISWIKLALPWLHFPLHLILIPLHQKQKHWFLHTGKKHWFLSTAPKISNPFQTRNFLLAIQFSSQYKSVWQKSISASFFFPLLIERLTCYRDQAYLVPRKKVKNEQVKKSLHFFFSPLFQVREFPIFIPLCRFIRASPPMLSMWPCTGKSSIRFINQIEWKTDHWDPEKMHGLQSPGGALEVSNKQSQIVFIDCSLFLIG